MKAITILATTLAATLPFAAQADAASDARQLMAAVNAWRAAPANCQGKTRTAVAVLAPQRVLSRIALRPGTILLAALDQAGYDPEVADAVQVAGPGDVQGAFDALRDSYCSTLGSLRYRDIGAHREGNEWTIVLAAATQNPALILPDVAEAGRQVLAATNQARAAGRKCGDTWMPAAPPVTSNDKLAAAALAHSKDMAQRNYFSHFDKQGNEVVQRAEAAGYPWRHIAENIAKGQTSPQDAVASWVSSPGHCRALMNPRFTEMGAAFSVREGKRPAAYWTQVFGTPR